jgi:hypothetical protein
MSLDYIRKKIYERKLTKSRNIDAQDIYDKRVEAIKEIVNTQGFKEIIEYWQREVKIHDERLDEMPKRPESILESRRVAKNFLAFLENLVVNAVE